MKKFLPIVIALLLSFSLVIPVVSADETLVDETTEISPLDHKSYSLNFDRDTNLEISMDADDTVNIYLMEENEYQFYEEGMDFEYIQEGSGEEVSSFSSSVELSEGDYYLVVENNNLLFSVEVTLEVTASPVEIIPGIPIPGFTSILLVSAMFMALVVYHKKS